ncbi:hypothetical protein ACFL0V_04925, partial [Nanoarchaeota archaeon]
MTDREKARAHRIAEFKPEFDHLETEEKIMQEIDHQIQIAERAAGNFGQTVDWYSHGTEGGFETFMDATYRLEALMHKLEHDLKVERHR